MNQTHVIEGFVSGLVKQFTARPDTVSSELSRLESIRHRTLSLVAGMTEEQASFSPKAGVWSTAQILDHIVLFEALYRDAMEKLINLARQGRKPEIRYGLKDIDVSVAGVPQAALSLLEIPLDVANYFIPSFVRQTIIRFPIVAGTSPKIANPRPNLSIDTLRVQLLDGAKATRDLLSGPLPAKAQDMKISHPLLGINNLVDLLGLMAAHEERHHEQIRGVIGNPGYPRSA